MNIPLLRMPDIVACIVIVAAGLTLGGATAVLGA